MAVKHQVNLPKLNRDSNHRKALFRNQLTQLIENGSLTTTVTKAKIIKRLFDKLVTKAKQGSLASRRSVIASLGNATPAHRLVDTIAPAFGDRTSGFTTIQKTVVRRGDATALATLKLMAEIIEPVKEEKIAKAKKETLKVSKKAKKA